MTTIQRCVAFPLFLFTLLLAGLTADATAQTKAQNFAHQQNFASDPPSLGNELTEILNWSHANGFYFGLAPNFPTPQPSLPPDVQSVLVNCDAGGFVTSSIPSRCVTRWQSCLVVLRFDDGSEFVYQHVVSRTQCANGWQFFTEQTRQSADAGPPGNVDSFRIQWSYDDILSQRRRGMSVITPAGAAIASRFTRAARTASSAISKATSSFRTRS